jgi:hypothetical protein
LFAIPAFITSLISFHLFGCGACFQSWASEIAETVRARRVDDLWASMKAEERAEPLKVCTFPPEYLGLAGDGISYHLLQLQSL